MCERQTDECLSLIHTHTGVRQNGRGTPALHTGRLPGHPSWPSQAPPGSSPTLSLTCPPYSPGHTRHTSGPPGRRRGCSQATPCLFLGPFRAPLLQVEKQPGSRPERPLTTLSSGTDRLNVHSWLFTKASVKQEGERK